MRARDVRYRAGARMVGMAAGPAAAQTDEEFDKIFPFLGHWDPQISGPDGQDRGNCGGRGRERREAGELYDASGSTSPELW